MAVLVDTCGWIEWLTDGALADQFKPFMYEPGALIVPTAIQLGLYKWVKREYGETEALDTIAIGDVALSFH